MKLITQSQLYKDRLFLNIVTSGKFTSDDSILRGMSSKFILAKRANLNVGGVLQTAGCFGAYVNANLDMSINGDFLLVEIPGINFDGCVVRHLDPTLPGDLAYIDGCSNSVIVPPGRNGEPCINYLYFPPGIFQTAHTHPSVRIGYIMEGEGFAHVGEKKKLPLKQGDMFILEKHELHNFSTKDSSMSLLVFHPDSESGSTDEFNTMKSRTYIQK
jgi:quercetin dioxygenase-like cupin family protein